MKRFTALLVCASLLSGCASSGVLRMQAFNQERQEASPAPADRTLLAQYVQKLPLGTKVRVARRAGGDVTGTLMQATDQLVVVQRRTRLPEPPDRIPLDEIVAITPESPSGVAKAIGIGAAAGAGAALAVFLILIAIYSD